MNEVELQLSGRTYRIACEDGQEDRLQELARQVDLRMQRLSEEFGNVGHMRLLVMTSLLIIDELLDSRQAIDEAAAASETRVAAVVEQVTGRIEAIADRLQGG